MKIALFGYGKMGKIIEKISLDRNHTIVAINNSKSEKLTLNDAQVAIDFSTPETAYQNILFCFKKNIPVVCGTTGWLDNFELAKKHCNQNNGAFIYASNFSLGVNVFFKLNQYLAEIMDKINDYSIVIEEIHHTQKKDRPSGTAITLAEGIIQHSNKTSWEPDVTNNEKSIPIISKRIKEVPGTHIVSYKSKIDSIKIEHEAHNRNGFALGAVIAAEWILGKKGIFTMNDVLELS